MNLLPLWASLVLVGWGAWKMAVLLGGKTSSVRPIIPLFRDAIQSYSWRLISNILQLSIYVSMAIAGLSYFFFSQIPLVHIACGFMGAGGILLVSVIQLWVLPYAIESILKNSHTYPWVGLNRQFGISASFSALYGGVMILLTWVCVAYLGPQSILGIAMGVTLATFYIRISGGILKCASKNGNEIGVTTHPDFSHIDSRNPASYIEMLGGFLGNGLGYQADLKSSLAFTLVSFLPFLTTHELFFLPLNIVALGCLAAIPAYLWCQYRISHRQFSNVFLEGIYMAATLVAMGVFVLLWHTGAIATHSPISLFLAYLTGLAGAIVLGFLSEWLTSSQFFPSRDIAYHFSIAGSQAMARAMENGFYSNSLLGSGLVLLGALAYMAAGWLGISMAALGMLSVIVVIMTSNFSGPVASLVSKMAIIDNQSTIVQQNAKRIEGIAATTIAIRGGFPASATLLSSVAMGVHVLSYLPSVHTLSETMTLVVGIALLGLVMPYLMGALISRVTRKTTQLVMAEMVRQIREIPHLLTYKSMPDVAFAIDRISRRIMDGLILPGCLLVCPLLGLAFFAGNLFAISLIAGVFASVFTSTYLWWTMGDALHHTRQFIQSGHMGGGRPNQEMALFLLDQTGNVYRDVLSPASTAMIKAMLMLAVVLLMIISQFS